MSAAYEKTAPAVFDPRAAAHRWRFWVRVRDGDAMRLHIFWRRVALGAAAGALALWLALAGGAWAFLVFQRDWREARFIDLALLPWRQAEFRRGLAAHHVARGRIELNRKNHRVAYAHFGAALARDPGDLTTRRTVALIEAQAGLRPRALETLAGGLAHTPDLAYLRLTFGWLAEARETERALALATRLLPATPGADLRHQYLALEVATAHFAAARFDAARELLARWNLALSLEGLLLLARIDWETGRPHRALHRLTLALERPGPHDEIYLHLIRWNRALGLEAEARRCALRRGFAAPNAFGPRLDLLHAYRAAGDTAAEARELAACLAEHGEDARAITQLAWFAADTDQPALLARLAAHAEERGFAPGEFDLARMQCALARREFAAAIAASAGAARSGALMEGLRAVARFGAGDTTAAGVELRAFAVRSRLPIRDSLWLARELRLVGAEAEARFVLERVAEAEPRAQPAIAGIIRIDARLGNQAGLQQWLPRYLAFLQPSPDVLIEAALALDRGTGVALRREIRATLARLAPPQSPERFLAAE